MGLQRRTYTSEFKAEAVALVRRTGQSANQIAKELGVSQTALSRWLREAARHRSNPNGFHAAEELHALRRDTTADGARHPKKAGVRSTGGRNTCREYIRWRLESQCLPRTLIQAQGDRV